MALPVAVSKSRFAFAVSCPLLPDCHSQGATRAAALSNIKDAISTYCKMIRLQSKGSPQ